MIAGLIHQGVAPAASIICAGPNGERCEELGDRHGIRHSTDNATAVENAGIVVLAVKPQRSGPGAQSTSKGRIDPSALVVSIIAGATIDRISSGSGARHDRAFDAEHARSDR